MAPISMMLTNSLTINNYHNYMTYFLIFSHKTLQIGLDILNLFTYIFYLHLFSLF